MSRVYVAGPMRGYPLFNFPAFDEAASQLRLLGCEVFNPADHDRDGYGNDITPENAEAKGFSLRDALAADLNWIARNADAIAVLDGWERSAGANAEVALAHALGIPVAPIYWFGADGLVIPAERHCVTPTKLEQGDLFSNEPPQGVLYGDRSLLAAKGYDLTDEQCSRLQDAVFGGEVRSVSSTGGEKGTKLARFDLIPTGPEFELAEHYGRGSLKYADRNWERGYEWSKSYAALRRHLGQFWSREDFDDDSGSKHIIAVAWHAFALAEFMDTHPEFDDRPATRTYLNALAEHLAGEDA